MNHRRVFIIALAAAAAASGAALADGTTSAGCGNSTAPPSYAARSFDASVLALPAGTRYDAVRYRPRPSGGRSYVTESPTQLHIGFFEPNGHGSTSFAFGFRGGPSIDDRIQLGLAADWYHNSESQRVVAGDPYQVGNNLVTPERVLARASSNLFPILLFMQVSAGNELQVIPYFGAAGGYEVLLLSATDYNTSQNFDATYGGWGWQVWGGVALPLSGRSRLNGEVFVNQGDVERDVTDALGNTYRERVDADGVGMRFGLSWGF
jgi:hypothetical protein